MRDPNWLFSDLELVVDLCTKESLRRLLGFLLLLLSGAALFVGAVYIITGRGPF